MPKFRIVAILIVIILMTACINEVNAEQDFAVTLYGGQMTDGSSSEVIAGQVSFIDAYVVVGALSWTFARYYDDALSLELEGQIGKWFGEQDNWEANLPVAIRWSAFPWDDYVSTSLAFGLGVSYAFSLPEAEVDINDSTKQFLIYWYGEIAIGPPDSDWAFIFRLHHRSGGFGLIADQWNGGSNAISAGLRYRF